MTCITWRHEMLQQLLIRNGIAIGRGRSNPRTLAEWARASEGKISRRNSSWKGFEGSCVFLFAWEASTSREHTCIVENSIRTWLICLIYTYTLLAAWTHAGLWQPGPIGARVWYLPPSQLISVCMSAWASAWTQEREGGQLLWKV